MESPQGKIREIPETRIKWLHTVEDVPSFVPIDRGLDFLFNKMSYEIATKLAEFKKYSIRPNPDSTIVRYASAIEIIVPTAEWIQHVCGPSTQTNRR